MLCRLIFVLLVVASYGEACWKVEKTLPNVLPFKKTQSKCYDRLGCFPIFEKSNEMLKLLSAVFMHSDAPEEIDVHFNQFSCRNRYKSILWDYNATDAKLRNSTYSGSKQTVVIIHGYRDSYNEMNWMADIKDSIIDQFCDIYNVITVDWRNASQTCNYFNSVADTQIVGAVAANFMRRLMSLYGQTPDNFTVVGHSLGAHVAGFVGANFTNPKLKMILGLDPAGPAFSDISTKFRLDPSDARLVTTIHTNAGVVSVDGFGIKTPLGHYSFFPNGGFNQPGCENVHGVARMLLDGVFQGLADTVACSHRRPTILVPVNESLFNDCEQIAYKCDSYEAFQDGQCGTCREGSDECKLFDSWFDAWRDEPSPKNATDAGKYYLDTNDIIPYCVYHYQMKITTGPGEHSFKGQFKVTPSGTLRNAERFHFKSASFKIEPETTYTALVKMPKNLGRLKEVKVKASEDGILGSKVIFRQKAITIASIEFNHMSARTEAERLRFSSKAVATPGDEWTIEAGGERIFTMK